MSGRATFGGRALTVLAGQGGRLALGAISAFVIAAAVGPSAKGILGVLVGLSTIAAAILSLGLPGAITYLLAGREWTRAEALGAALITVLVGLTGTAAVLVFAGPWLRPLMSGSPVWWLLVAVGAQTAAVSMQAYSLGVQDFRSHALQAAGVPVITLAAFFVLHRTGASPAFSAVMSWLGALSTVAAVAFVVAWARSGRKIVWPARLINAFRYGIRSATATAINSLNLRLDVVLLGALGGSFAAGQYSIGVQFSEAIWLAPTAVGYVLFPVVAADATDDGVRTARLSRLSVVFGGVVGILALAAAGIYGFIVPAYRESVIAVALLMPGTVAFCVAKVVGNDLYGRGRPEVHIYAALAAVLVTVVGNVLLVPLYGMLGAAAVSSAAYALYALVVVVFFRNIVTATVGVAIPRKTDLSDVIGVVRSRLRTHAEPIDDAGR